MEAVQQSGEPASPTLSMRLLGGFDLSVDGQPITSIDAPRLQSLLAYLVLNLDAGQPRERLAFLFWPDSEGSQARTNLRQALHLLRRALPDSERFLKSDARVVRWRADAPFLLDVAEFERLVSRAGEEREAGVRKSEREALERAVATYAGDLLPDSYDEWIDPERERLREAFLGAAERLAELLELERDYRAAIPWTRRLLDRDPLNESSCQRLMRLYALAGDRAGALRVYHGYATALAREAGVEPSAATRDAYERLLEPIAPPTPREVASPTVGASPLVGRTAEWESLQAAWRRAAGGEAVLAMVAGEAGIGKSRLCEELRDWVGHQGIATAASRCYAAAGGLAYAPIVELLRSPTIGAQLRRLGDHWLTELARLLPELLDERPELAPPPPLTDDWQRARLLDALSHAFLVEERPLLLSIDDLQWCDGETLAWLHYILRSRPTAPLLVLATARSEEFGPDHPAQPLVHASRASGQAVELELQPLSQADTAALAGNVAGHQLDDERNAIVYRETEGNPLFVVEWMRAGLAEHGELREFAPRTHSVIEARLAQLSPAGQELASLAATVGRDFTFDVLVRASSLSEEHLVEALDELWERRIVRERGVDGYDFGHDKLREAAYLRVGSARRRMLHGRVAQALERLHAGDLDGISGDLAAHYEAAGWNERAIGFYARAAEVAQRVYANERAIDLFSRALELLDAEPPSRQRDERELELRIGLGSPLVAIEGYGAPSVHDVYLRAQELCERLGERPGPPVLRAFALVNMARCELEQAYEHGEQLLELGERDDEPMVRVEGNYVLGVASFWLGEFARARDQLERAVAEYVPGRARSHLALYSQDPRVICLSRLALTLHYLGEPELAEDKAREALRLAEELEHPFSLAYALHFTALVAMERGDEPVARERAERMAKLAEDERLGFLQPMGGVFRGWILSLEGRADEATALIREGLDEYTRSGWTLYQPYGLVLLARICLDAGRSDEGRSAIEQGFQLTEQIGQRCLDAHLHLLMAELIVAGGGERSDAESHVSTALEVARRQSAPPLVQRATESLERLGAVSG
jgi:DNA-binding SARP family transcriptional activator